MEKIPYVAYNSLSPRKNNGTGKLTIEGLDISVSFMSRLWAQMKKRIKKEYQVDVTATFQRDNEDNKITCIFLRNGVYALNHDIDPRIYERRFEDTFPFWVNDFEQILEKVSFDIIHENNEDKIIHSCFPEKKTRNERKARKAATKAAKKARKNYPKDINEVDTAKASI